MASASSAAATPLSNVPRTYALITPVRDEEGNLPRLAAALERQTLLPSAWIIVDDGSRDRTADLLADLARKHAWIKPVDRGSDEGRGVAAGRREGRDLVSFRLGITALDEPVDVVMKLDADVDFDADYCERLMARFAADPALGIASGTCHEPEGGEWVRRTKADTTVWGASRAYRWECVEDIFGLEPRMGWDGLDELLAHVRGMRTETFVDLPFRHHRPEGGREHSSLHQGAALGRASWYMGYRPSYLAMRAFYRARRQPTAVAMLWGYAAAALAREPRYANRAVVRLLRDRQRLRVTLRRG
ncbi:MAG: glycosyltransferase family 2 protein, partial [Solirubrobacteraceae bacterium]